jgi:peptidoglycan/LPS O-acetylase OafA/YrhL
MSSNEPMSSIGFEAIRKALPNHLSGIESSRGIAAALVILYHVARHLNKIYGAPLLAAVFQFGHMGVDFFFVVSGFIILFVHYDDIGKPARVGHYCARRLTRLFPIYWIAIAVTVFLDIAGGHDAPSFADLFWSATLLPSNHPLILGIAWTLRFEVLFYIVFGVLIMNRKAGLIISTAWLAATILGSVMSLQAAFLPEQICSVFNLEFFLGMGAGYWLRNHTVRRPRLVLGVGCTLFVIAALLEDIDCLNGYNGIAHIAYGIPAAIIVLAAGEASRQHLVPVFAVLKTLGSASYSLYLFQFVFIGAGWQAMRATRLDQFTPVFVQFLALVMVAVAGGIIMSIWVEFPLLRMFRRRYALRPAHPIKG